LVSPVDFIPVAEETGLIVPIGQWVLNEACKHIRECQLNSPSHRSLSLSVNLSARQVAQPDLLERIKQALETSKLNPHCLKLEITESVVMLESDLTESIIRGLAALGVRIAIDDFGVGYSALGYLRRLSADTLKIDRSFVAGLGTSREDAAIVSATIALARALDLSVTAEGIETPEQAAVLRGLGCDRGQGFLFSRPVTADGLVELLAASGEAAFGSGRAR
jgi:EAL domain-containing protein (putative c-di-GMP-specific phosphodiesterase class I)